jgi:CheY-like chemotaxis protein
MSGEARECVLVIEGNAVDARLISKALTNSMPSALSIECVTRLNSAVERIRQGGVRALILDIELPHSQGVATFEGLLCAAPHIPILILSGRNAGEEKTFFQQQCAELTLSCTGDTVLIGDSAGRVTHLNANGRPRSGGALVSSAPAFGSVCPAW